MYFLFHALAFEDVMKLENLQVLKSDFLENEKSFCS